MDPTFTEFSASYTSAADFPPEARKQIPEWLHVAIDAGNESFFAEMHEPLPKLYEVFTKQAGRIHLLEARSVGFGLSNRGKETKLYCWGLKCGDNVIAASIPVGDSREGAAAEIDNEYLACIPTFLTCFYRKMDGMAVTRGRTAVGLDLPAAFAHWRPLADFYDDTDVPGEYAQQVYQTLKRDDLRVLIQCSNGDLVLCGDSPKSQALYLVKDKRKAQALTGDVRSRLDAYFANAVQGKPAQI